MSDNKKNQDYHDRDRINVNEDYELQYWSKKFGVSADDLRQAVSRVGVMVKDVKNHFNK